MHAYMHARAHKKEYLWNQRLNAIMNWSHFRGEHKAAGLMDFPYRSAYLIHAGEFALPSDYVLLATQ